jgi:hypothetical protein
MSPSAFNKPMKSGPARTPVIKKPNKEGILKKLQMSNTSIANPKIKLIWVIIGGMSPAKKIVK